MKKLHKNRLWVLVFVGCAFSALAQSDSIAKHYGLKVVADVLEYREQTVKNSDLKLVDLQIAIPSLVMDIRYATANNFVGIPVYTTPKAYVRRPVAEALEKVQQALQEKGLGLVIYDAYRPYTATVLFFETYSDSTFVAHPSTGSRHNRGCAVDVGLVDLATGNYLEMPTEFDDFTDRAHPNYQDLPETVTQNRELLRSTMETHGFSVYHAEWWHFDFVGWEGYPLMDIPFERL